MPPIEIALPKAIEERWAKYAKELLRCRRKFTEAAVHDLRIACRRMIALIDVLLMIIPQRTLKRLGRDLKRQLSTLSPLRDTQMEILEVRRLVERHPQLKPFLTVLLLREQRLLKSARNRIGEIKGEDHREEIQAVITSLREALAELEVKGAAIRKDRTAARAAPRERQCEIIVR